MAIVAADILSPKGDLLPTHFPGVSDVDAHATALIERAGDGTDELKKARAHVLGFRDALRRWAAEPGTFGVNGEGYISKGTSTIPDLRSLLRQAEAELAAVAPTDPLLKKARTRTTAVRLSR